MAIFEWRTFKFFDLQPDVDQGKVGAALQDSTITSSTNGLNQIIICDSDGVIHVFNRNWEAISFKAHTGPISFCALGLHNNHLITIGSEDHGLVPVFKVHNLSKPTADRDYPCVRTVKLAVQKPTALAVSENCQYMAIGFERGIIYLYRGDISRNRSITAQTFNCGTSSIVGMAFRMLNKVMQLFVCSDSGVFVYVLNEKKETQLVLDQTATTTRCCLLQNLQNPGEGHFMVGRDDAVYCYNSDGRGPCYALDGVKSTLQWFRSYLLSVSKPDKIVSSEKNSLLTVIDIPNKVVGFKEMIGAVAGIFIEFGTCFVITANKQVLHLEERDIQSKLDPLFKQNLYDIAVRIAKMYRYDDEGLAEIFKNYGDYLLTKLNYNGAVEQYVKTIGFLEPSYVIRKFLDSRHINHLTDYLQALHKCGKATANHTTLLLNCFTRLNRTDQIKEFLQFNDQPDINFDLDVAIKVCRTSCVDVALSLARQHGKHEVCLSIMIEDCKQYLEAVQYISKLPFASAEENLSTYGATLMQHCPNEMTELLKKICTNFVVESSEGSSNGIGLSDDLALPKVDRSDPVNYIHLFGIDAERTIDFLEHLRRHVNINESMYNTLIELYLDRWQEHPDIEAKIMDILQKPGDKCDLNHAMMLCRMHEFWPGLMYIYEEQNLYHLIVRHHIKKRNYNDLIATCESLGKSHPELWFQALTGLRKDKECPGHLLSQILQHIALGKLQSPLQVLKCLAVEDGPNLESVRDYFVQTFYREKEAIKEEEQAVKSYTASSTEHSAEIEALRNSPVEYRGTSCAVCQQLLTMPAIYFMCKDSFHQDCLRGFAENETQCPVCVKKPATLQLLDLIQAQNDSRDQHGRFHDQLDRTREPFTLVAEYLGRGLFNQVILIDEGESEDINRNVQDTVAPITPAPPTTMPYGPGAEANIRLKEAQHMKQEEAIKRVPIPEARMRLQESAPKNASPKPNAYLPSASTSASFVAPRKVAVKVAPENYDPAKDPFADEVVEPKKPLEPAASNNPFGDYDEDEVIQPARKTLDSNLNPFE